MKKKSNQPIKSTPHRSRSGKNPCDPLDRILHIAARHGIDSDFEHEIGDLQEALEIAFSFLNRHEAIAVLEKFGDRRR